MSATVHTYSQFERAWERADECFYCGELAGTVDHVLPRWWERDVTDEVRRYAVTVPACRSCNSILGGAVLLRFTDRCAFIERALVKKHQRVLKAPDWTEQELLPLGRALQDHVRARGAMKRSLRRRLARLRRQVGPGEAE